jgi:hypothetical protein
VSPVHRCASTWDVGYLKIRQAEDGLTPRLGDWAP